MLIVKNIV